jgi:hypothetical protein
MKVDCTLVAAAVLVLATSPAVANPRPLPFTYPYETLAEGSLELELYTDVNPLRVLADDKAPASGRLWSPEYIVQAELEYGVTDRVELGFYQVFKAEPQSGGDNALQFDGLKWRVRTRLAEAGQWPVDVGFYLELETMHDELALEGKVNLQRRAGPVRLMANLWVEESLVRPLDSRANGRTAEFIVDPTAGFVYEVTPMFQPGLEYWSRGELKPHGEGQERTDAAVQHYVGPTVHLNFGKLWWSAGIYGHLNDLDKPQIGQTWGPAWFRSVLGLEL